MKSANARECKMPLFTRSTPSSSHSFYLLFACVLFLTTPLKSDTLSLLFENDLFAGTDKHYTNGVRLGWMDDPQQKDVESGYTELMYGAVDTVPFLHLEPKKEHNAGFSIHQMMFTPQNITATEADYEDIPYTGHLAFSFFLFEYDADSYDEYKLQLGIVGPLSGAAAVQKLFHRLTHSTQPKGWDTQLGNHLTAAITYDHGSRLWQKKVGYGLSSDVIGSYGAQLGNFYSGAVVSGRNAPLFQLLLPRSGTLAHKADKIFTL
jgi:lipid A 3-O-deacylase